jgi:hypothetical protein
MDISKSTNIAIVVRHTWANLHGVRVFLRQYEEPHREIRSTDDSHIVFADILDGNDPRGLWIELNTERHKEDPTLDRFKLLIPWNDVLTIIMAEKFSSAVREEAKKIGFNPNAQKSSGD